MRSPFPGPLLGLAYHCVDRPEPGFPFDEDVIDASPETFDAQMATVARYFRAMSVSELDGVRLPPNAIFITFDDGYRCNLHTAVPILKRHGLKATFFVSTRFVRERRPFWWDRIAYLVKSSRRERIALHYPYDLALDLRAPADAIDLLLRLVKETFGLDVDRLLDELAVAAGVPWDREIERAIADRLVLTWDDVRALRDAGMDVQSHTATHRVLATMTPAEAQAELVESRAELEQELRAPVRAISYPCGQPIEHDPALVASVRAAGYELGFSACGGVNHAGDHRSRPLHLARVLLDAQVSMPEFRAILAVPHLRAQ